MRAAEALEQTTRLPPALCAILARRGVTADEAESYLAPALRDLLPDPRSLRDMETAARLWVSAARGGKRIAVFADYDVDGGSSAALLVTWLREIGAPSPTLYVPDRIDEGYGPNAPAIAALARAHDLIVCVDCGTLSHDALAAAGKVPVVVLDHHLGGDTLPEVAAVVNPNRQDEDGTLGHLCAAGVVFLMLVEAGRQLREAARKGPDLIGMLDLVALATVADVAPLTGVNRAFVRQGLTIMARRNRAGLTALADVAGLNTLPAAYHLGYLLGPRVNAGGRIGKADLGARLLATADADEAEAIAERLDLLNSERREIEAAVTEAALAQAEARGTDGALVWAAGEGWHPGVVGIVAARLKEATGRPAVVIGFDEAGIGKGSGRSVSGVDLGAAIQKLSYEGAIEKGGGHRMAAGLTVTRAQLEPAMALLSDALARQGAHLRGPEELRIAGLLMPGAATVELIEEIERAGPFGAGAPAPRFVLPDMTILSARRVGEDHLKLSIGDRGGPRLDAIAFKAFSGPLGPELSTMGAGRFHLAGRLEVNAWGGRMSPQLRIEDAARA
jgi:single-stranded-DNA-specific exonuclease